MAVVEVRPLSPSSPTPPPLPGRSFEPRPPVLPRLLKVHQSFSKTGDLASNHLLDRLENEQRHLQRWSKERLSHLETVAKNASKEWAWSYLQGIAGVVVACFAFYYGRQTSSPASTPLIVAGVSNILQAFLVSFFKGGEGPSEAMANHAAFSKERLKTWVPFVFFLLNLALSAYASYVHAVGKDYDLLTEQLTTLSSVLSAGASLNQLWTTYKQLDAQAQLIEINGKLDHHTHGVERVGHLISDTFRELRRIKSLMKKPIYSLMQATTLASQKV